MKYTKEEAWPGDGDGVEDDEYEIPEEATIIRGVPGHPAGQNRGVSVVEYLIPVEDDDGD